MRNRFDRQLEELNEMLIHMGELCETAIGKRQCICLCTERSGACKKCHGSR